MFTLVWYFGTMSAMTRALFLQDILELILEELSPGPQIRAPTYDQTSSLLAFLRSDRHRRQSTLLHLALVCRALSDLALRVLWRYVDDIVHLLKVSDNGRDIVSNAGVSYSPHSTTPNTAVK